MGGGREPAPPFTSLTRPRPRPPAGRRPTGRPQVQHLKVPFSYYHLSYLLLLTCLVCLAWVFIFINSNKGNPVSLIIYPAIVVVLSGLQASRPAPAPSRPGRPPRPNPN